MSPRVVFDTNVLFSAVGWGGVPGRCVELVQAGRIRGLTCPEILNELGDKLAAKLCYSQEQIVVVVASLLTFFDLVNISGTLTGPQTDRRDDKILECSVTGAATHIVTGDRRHLLQLRRFAGAEILTPAQLIPIVEASPA